MLSCCPLRAHIPDSPESGDPGGGGGGTHAQQLGTVSHSRLQELLTVAVCSNGCSNDDYVIKKRAKDVPYGLL